LNSRGKNQKTAPIALSLTFNQADSMARQTKQKLSETAVRRLSILATMDLDDKQFAATLQEVLIELETLPAHAVVWAEQSIAVAGALHRQNFNLAQSVWSFKAAKSDPKTLRRHPALAFLWLCHRNGYAREEAVKSILIPPTSGFFLATLFSRLNDWVEPVRVEASRCIERLFYDIRPEVIVAASPYLLSRWMDWKRWNSKDIALLDRLLARSDVAAALAKKFRARAEGPLASQMRSLLRNDAIDKYLPSLVVESENPAVRIVCLRVLARSCVEVHVGFERKWIDKVYGHFRLVPSTEKRPVRLSYDINKIIAQCLRDRSTAIRRVAADVLIERYKNFPDVDSCVARLLQDKSKAVRERGEFLQRQLQK
jgi:hypothetical protein